MNDDIDSYFQYLITEAIAGDIVAGKSLLEIASVHIWSSKPMPRVLEEYISVVLRDACNFEPKDCSKALNIYKGRGRHTKDSPTILRDIQFALWVLEEGIEQKDAAYLAVTKKDGVIASEAIIKKAYTTYEAIAVDIHNKEPNKPVRKILPVVMDALIIHSKKKHQ